MKHLTKIFVGIALVIFTIGIILQFMGEETSAIKLFIATIMFMICAFISRHNDRKKRK
ncbi:SE1626 family protein [Staphylococcus canis]|uniref:SE1626 family protein n=1 Tax=Staphylococcus canis TaxID=2724942 RepID=UPI003D818F05